MNVEKLRRGVLRCLKKQEELFELKFNELVLKGQRRK